MHRLEKKYDLTFDYMTNLIHVFPGVDEVLYFNSHKLEIGNGIVVYQRLISDIYLDIVSQ